MKSVLALLAAMFVAFVSPAYGQDDEAQRQIQTATEAGKKMGVKLPDIDKLMEESAKTHTESTDNSTGPANLPDWTPQVPQFTAKGPVARKMVNGEERIVVAGTSPLTPDALADAWETFQSPKLAHERTGSTINGSVSRIVTFSKVDSPLEQVRLEADRSAGAQITQVVISAPIVAPQATVTEASDEPAQSSPVAEGSPATESTPPASSAPAAKVDLPAGTATGSITFDGATATMKFAAAFVDQKDSDKPTILIISDQKLPTDKWTSEFDMMGDHTNWSGLTIFLKDGKTFRTDVHTKGRQASVSGIFEVQIENGAGNDLAGTAKSDASSKDDKVDVAFHATRK